jgi:hypothetical protein
MVAQMLAEVGGGESRMLKDIAAALALSTQEDLWLRVGKDGLFRGVMCSDYGPQRDYIKVAVTGDMLARVAPRFLWKFWPIIPMIVNKAKTTPIVSCLPLISEPAGAVAHFGKSFA